VQPIAGDINVFDAMGGIQCRKLHTNLWSVLGLNSLLAAIFVELLESLMLEGLDHFRSVACCATHVKPRNASSRGGRKAVPARSALAALTCYGAAC